MLQGSNANLFGAFKFLPITCILGTLPQISDSISMLPRSGFAAGLGQRFLKRFLANAEDTEKQPSGDFPLLSEPSIPSGHLEGEGVRNYATLVAEAVTSRSRESSTHKGERTPARCLSYALPVSQTTMAVAVKMSCSPMGGIVIPDASSQKSLACSSDLEVRFCL